MSYEITFRFPWSTLEESKVHQAVQATLRDYAGAAVDNAAKQDRGFDYTLSLPRDVVQQHRDDFDDPLPAPEDGLFRGSFSIRANEELGASLVLDGDRNGHVWGLMSEIVTSIAEKLEGRLDQDEEEEDEQEQDEIVEDQSEPLRDEPLTTWEVLEQHARRAYPLDGEGEGWFATTVSWSDTPRTHQVRVTHFEREAGEPWVVLRSAVCKREQLSPEEALRRNDELPVAMLALSGDVYELVYSFPLEALTVSRFDLLLDQIAADADDLEEIFSGGDEF